MIEDMDICWNWQRNEKPIPYDGRNHQFPPPKTRPGGAEPPGWTRPNPVSYGGNPSPGIYCRTKLWYSRRKRRISEKVTTAALAYRDKPYSLRSSTYWRTNGCGWVWSRSVYKQRKLSGCINGKQNHFHTGPYHLVSFNIVSYFLWRIAEEKECQLEAP